MKLNYSVGLKGHLKVVSQLSKQRFEIEYVRPYTYDTMQCNNKLIGRRLPTITVMIIIGHIYGVISQQRPINIITQLFGK